MKRVITTILALSIILTLFACSNKPASINSDLVSSSNTNVTSDVNLLSSSSASSNESNNSISSNIIECSHLWGNATCTVAKTCSTCGATSGSALGHSWNNATCTTIKTCSRCGITSGSVLGHNWKEATCTNPKTCSRCGITSGSALGHTSTYGICGRCGINLGTKIFSLGETWIVDGQWKLTFISVVTTTKRNQFSDLNPAQVINITYTYENLGYTGRYQDLYVSSMDMDIYDANGESTEAYPTINLKSPTPIAVGMKCVNAQESFALNNASSEITLVFDKYDSNSNKQKATFKLKVN